MISMWWLISLGLHNLYAFVLGVLEYDKISTIFEPGSFASCLCKRSPTRMIQSGNTFARLWSQVKVACFDILIGAGNTVATKISHGFELLLKGRDNVRMLIRQKYRNIWEYKRSVKILTRHRCHGKHVDREWFVVPNWGKNWKFGKLLWILKEFGNIFWGILKERMRI